MTDETIPQQTEAQQKADANARYLKRKNAQSEMGGALATVGMLSLMPLQAAEKLHQDSADLAMRAREVIVNQLPPEQRAHPDDATQSLLSALDKNNKKLASLAKTTDHVQTAAGLVAVAGGIAGLEGMAATAIRRRRIKKEEAEAQAEGQGRG